MSSCSGGDYIMLLMKIAVLLKVSFWCNLSLSLTCVVFLGRGEEEEIYYNYTKCLFYPQKEHKQCDATLSSWPGKCIWIILCHCVLKAGEEGAAILCNPSPDWLTMADNCVMQAYLVSRCKPIHNAVFGGRHNFYT